MVKVIRPDDRDLTTSQTTGMRREAGISGALTGAGGVPGGDGDRRLAAGDAVAHLVGQHVHDGAADVVLVHDLNAAGLEPALGQLDYGPGHL